MSDLTKSVTTLAAATPDFEAARPALLKQPSIFRCLTPLAKSSKVTRSRNLLHANGFMNTSFFRRNKR